MNQATLELKLLLRNKGFIIQLITYGVIALIALWIGHQNYDNQLQSILKQTSQYQYELETWKGNSDADPGSIGYYLYTPIAKTPSPWSILFRGESQEHMDLYRIRLLALQGQLHAEPLENSEHLRLTWLDLGFVWVYLLPLLIGLSLVTRTAEDKDTQRWQLFNTLLSNPVRFLAVRSAVLFTVVFLLNLTILALAILAFNLTINGDLVWLVALLFVYQLFWLCCVNLISHTVDKPQFSVVVFVFTWLFCTFILPSTQYLVSLDKSHAETGMDLLISQRQSINTAWDRNKQDDLTLFLEKYPEYKETSPLVGRFDWKWYYAMQTLSDDAVSSQYQKYTDNIAQSNRNTWARILSPSLNFELLLTRFANTDQQSQQNFEQQIIAWHQSQKAYWYPYLFFDLTYQPTVLDQAPAFQYSMNSHKDSVNIFWLITACLLFLILLTRKLRLSN